MQSTKNPTPAAVEAALGRLAETAESQVDIATVFYALQRARAFDPTATEEDFEVLYEIIVRVRDSHKRVFDDAPSEDVAEAIQNAGFHRYMITDELIEKSALAIADYDDSQPSGTFNIHEDNRGKALAVLKCALEPGEAVGDPGHA